ncbi:SMI1/KNR4 family protein [Zooshikella ganghwensis]|uniref:SMI1/KNR4 family protein n=1 Tax=Zooshikella ganghwensis TaxID=202772 RepID=A0A4P9VG55_9GAMM|nr:SMI1/KNR4 family protein [Zooshikella ganghwensis]RDH41319.1 hypothetical protein B9G39_29050 [Zooshikella ganghwensis]
MSSYRESDFISTINKYLSLAIERNYIKSSKIIGLNRNDIVKLEEKIGLEFPKAYKAFLGVCGREPAEFWSNVGFVESLINQSISGAHNLLK